MKQHLKPLAALLCLIALSVTFLVASAKPFECGCGPGYIPISSLYVPDLMPPHDPENDACYAAYCAAYYARKAAYDAIIAANRDPNCSDCVDAMWADAASLDWFLGDAEDINTYLKCVEENS